MRCISKKKSIIFVLCLTSALLCGCGKKIEISDPFELTNSATNITPVAVTEFSGSSGNLHYFAEDLCVAEDQQTKSDAVTDSVAEALGVFLPDRGEITYQKNLYEKIYPASTTKVLTCYIALTYGNLDDIVTVSEHAVDQPGDSSVCNLRAGDQIKLSDLLYGLMLRSGNDAAIAIAEHISGSEENFAVLMNDTAKQLGATNSHFVNPNGLHDEDHYTCAYDLYLIFSQAILNEQFRSYISTNSFTSNYVDASGNEASQTWSNTNKYLTGEVSVPDGITVVGGKTGTTNAAGYCLILYSMNSDNEPVISVVMKSDARSNLYYVMNQMLSNFSG